MEGTARESAWRDLARVVLWPAVAAAVLGAVAFVAAHPKHVRAGLYVAKILRMDPAQFPPTISPDELQPGPEFASAFRIGYRLTADRKKQEHLASLMYLGGDVDELATLVRQVGPDTPAETALVDAICTFSGPPKRWDWCTKEPLTAPAGSEELWRSDDPVKLLADVPEPGRGQGWPGLHLDKPVLRYRIRGYECEVTAEFRVSRREDGVAVVYSPAELTLAVRRPGQTKPLDTDFNYGRRGGIFRLIPLDEARGTRPAARVQ